MPGLRDILDAATPGPSREGVDVNFPFPECRYCGRGFWSWVERAEHELRCRLNRRRS